MPENEAETAEQARLRTEQSLRAEAAYAQWKDKPLADRKLTAGRRAHASALHRVIREHGLTIERLGDVLEVNERQARKYLEAEAPIPTTIFEALPRPIAEDFAAAIGRPGTLTPAEQLRRALARAVGEGLPESALMDAFAKLGELSARQRGGR